MIAVPDLHDVTDFCDRQALLPLTRDSTRFASHISADAVEINQTPHSNKASLSLVNMQDANTSFLNEILEADFLRELPPI